MLQYHPCPKPSPTSANRDRATFSGESAPNLRLAQVTASTVQEAMQKSASFSVAGESSLNDMKAWLNNPKNINSTKANKWKKTINFFPGAAGTVRVPYLVWLGGGFERHGSVLGFKWDHSKFRVVLLG